MRFYNPTAFEVRVDMPKGVLIAPAKGSVDIPDEHAWVVASRGMVLTTEKPADDGEPSEAAPKPLSKAERRAAEKAAVELAAKPADDGEPSES